MKKHFICLANSIKYRGRCLAGIEVSLDGAGRYTIARNEDETPQWIRPVSREKCGTLPESETKNIVLFDIIEIGTTRECPQYAHSENVFYSYLKKSGKKSFQSEKHLNDLCNNVHPMLLFNGLKSISTDVFQQSGYSLAFIRASNCTFWKDESDMFKDKFRVRFLYNNIEYVLPLTDPVFIHKLNVNGFDSINSAKHYYFTVSLSEEFKGWHYKLIAGIVEEPSL